MQKNNYDHLSKTQLIKLINNLRAENSMLHKARANDLKESEKDFEKKLKKIMKDYKISQTE